MSHGWEERAGAADRGGSETRRARRRALFLGLAALVSGCDTHGYASLGEPLDVLVPCGETSSVWVRSYCGRNAQDTEDGHLITELVTLGVDSLEGPGPIAGCFNLSQLHYDTSSVLRVGSFEGAEGTMRVSLAERYAFTLQADLPVLARQGSHRESILPPEERSFEYASDGKTLTLTDVATKEARVYRSLVDLAGSLDLGQAPDAYTFSNIASIPLYHSFTRLLGYGAGGMTQYMASPATYLAATSGSMYVRVEGLLMPLTTMRYDAFEEFGGFVLDGEFYTSVDPGGDGRSYGELGFSVRDDLDDPAAVITGRHDYTDVDVRNGIGATGCLTLVVDDGPSVPVPSEVFNSIDLSRALPTDGRDPGTVDPVCPNHVPKALTMCPRS